MTLEQFISRCEDSFGDKKYTVGQKAAIVEKCARFTERDLNRIYSDLLETCKYLPRIADIYDSARDMGLLENKQNAPHRWKPTDCNYCRGEGRIAVIWRCHTEERDAGIAEIQELVQVFTYSKSFDYKFKPNEYRSIFRCKCMAGDVETLPRSWPKWTPKSEPRRTVWL